MNTLIVKDTLYYLIELNKTIDFYKNKILYNTDINKLCTIQSNYIEEIDMNNDIYYYYYIVETNVKDNNISYSDKYISSSNKDKNVLTHLLSKYREIITEEQYLLLYEINEINKIQEELIKQYNMIPSFTL